MASPEDGTVQDYIDAVDQAQEAFEDCGCAIHEGILLMAKRLLVERAARD